MDSTDHYPTWEIDRLLAICHYAERGTVVKVRCAKVGTGDDSWEPISGLPKHLVVRVAKKRTFTLLDNAFPTTAVVLAPDARQPTRVCVALQHHIDDAGAILVDVRWASPSGIHEEATRALWMSFLFAAHTDALSFAISALRRPTFLQLDTLRGPHTVDLVTMDAAAHLPHFLPLYPTDAARGFTAAFSVDWANANGWENTPFAFLPQILSRLTTYPCDLATVAPGWINLPWWSPASRYCVTRVQLDNPYRPVTSADRSTPPSLWHVVVFRFTTAHTTRVNADASA